MVARLVHTILDHHQRLVHQRCEDVEHCFGLDPVSGAHGLRRVEREPVGEDGQPVQHQSLVRVEEIVAPVDGVPERPVASGHTAPLRCEESEPGSEATQHRVGRQRASPSGGELDRQRKAVEASTQLGNRGGVGVGQGKRRVRGACSIDEQAYRLGARDIVDRRGRLGNREPGNEPRPLAGDAECLATRRQEPHAGAVSKQEVGCRGARVDQVLAVVQHHQAFAVSEGISERVRWGAARAANAERRCDQPQEELRFGDRGELDPGSAIAEAVGGRPHDFGGQSRLPASSGSSERHEPSGREEDRTPRRSRGRVPRRT